MFGLVSFSHQGLYKSSLVKMHALVPLWLVRGALRIQRSGSEARQIMHLRAQAHGLSHDIQYPLKVYHHRGKLGKLLASGGSLHSGASLRII